MKSWDFGFSWALCCLAYVALTWWDYLVARDYSWGEQKNSWIRCPNGPNRVVGHVGMMSLASCIQRKTAGQSASQFQSESGKPPKEYKRVWVPSHSASEPFLPFSSFPPRDLPALHPRQPTAPWGGRNTSYAAFFSFPCGGLGRSMVIWWRRLSIVVAGGLWAGEMILLLLVRFWQALDGVLVLGLVWCWMFGLVSVGDGLGSLGWFVW